MIVLVQLLIFTAILVEHSQYLKQMISSYLFNNKHVLHTQTPSLDINRVAFAYNILRANIMLTCTVLAPSTWMIYKNSNFVLIIVHTKIYIFLYIILHLFLKWLKNKISEKSKRYYSINLSK